MVATYKSDVTAVVYIEVNQLFFYNEQLEDIASLGFSENHVSNMDVIDEEALIEHVSSWYKQIDIRLKRVIIILGPTLYFQKFFPKTEEGEESSETQLYLDSVPFDSVLSKKIEDGDGHTIIAANESFVDVLLHVFKEYEAASFTVIPAHLLMEEGQRFSFDEDQAKFVIRKQQELAKDSMSETEIKSKESKEDQTFTITTEKPKLTDRRFLLLIGVFGILIVILIYLVMQNMSLTMSS